MQVKTPIDPGRRKPQRSSEKMLWTSFSEEGREVILAQRFHRGHGSLKWNVLFWCVIYAHDRVAWPSVARHAVSAAARINAIHHNRSDRKHLSASHSNLTTSLEVAGRPRAKMRSYLPSTRGRLQKLSVHARPIQTWQVPRQRWSTTFDLKYEMMQPQAGDLHPQLLQLKHVSFSRSNLHNGSMKPDAAQHPEVRLAEAVQSVVQEEITWPLNISIVQLHD